MSFQKLFTESKGQSIIYNGKEIKMIDSITLLKDNAKIMVNFLSTNSIWKQGIILQTKGHFEGNNQKIPNKIILWENTSPKEVGLIIKSKDKILIVYNVWETQDGTIHYWHNGGAMYVEEKHNGRIYNCNDGFPDDDFNDLIFEINW